MTTLLFGQLCLITYAVLLLIGGIVGYTKAESKVSLVMGIGSGVLAALAYWLTRSNPTLGFSVGTVLALALTVVFILRYRKTGSFMPAGMMMGISILAALISGVALLPVG
jgi:uncharacterized membrane protein (UPF0136 family)